MTSQLVSMVVISSGVLCVDRMVWTTSANLTFPIFFLSSLNSVIKFSKCLLHAYTMCQTAWWYANGQEEVALPSRSLAKVGDKWNEIEFSFCCAKCYDRVNTGHQKVHEAEPWILNEQELTRGEIGAQGQREGISWESFTEILPRFKSADSIQNISAHDKFWQIFKSRYSVFQIKTCGFIDSRQASHLLKTELHPNLQITLLKRAAASETSSDFMGVWADSSVGPAHTLLTCMMSMAIACVWTPSTLFTSQCTTSALMKQHGERPFCSESSWTPVLNSNVAGRKQGMYAQGQRAEREHEKEGTPTKALNIWRKDLCSTISLHYS